MLGLNLLEELIYLGLGSTIVDHSLGEGHPHAKDVFQLIVVSYLPGGSLHSNHASEEEGNHSNELVNTMPLMECRLAFHKSLLGELDRFTNR